MTKILTFFFLLQVACADTKDKPASPVWTDPAKAKTENPDFSVQGEYKSPTHGAQVIALGKGQFHVSIYTGGLPGAGWDESPIESVTGDAEATIKATEGFKRIERSSPTLGEKAPEGAVVLFDGSNADAWKNGSVDELGLLESGTETKATFGSFKLHVEFRTPFKPETRPSSQDRGNSGIYTFGRYETQVLDSFGLDFDLGSWEKKPDSDPKQWCGCLYKFKLADTNMCLPPLTWQTYDIDFTAPKFDGDKKTANARITVVHNGVKIHDNVELPKGTGAGGGKVEIPKGVIQLQGHGNPIRYQNIWILEK
jgi:hypothetical protein